MRKLSLFLLLAACVSFRGPAHAGEARLNRDPKADLAKLQAQPITTNKPGFIQMATAWSDHTVRIDASAVGDDDYGELYALAGDYDAYKRLKMPYVDDAKVIQRFADGRLWVWSQMTLSLPGPDQTSQHYLEVTQHALPGGALGNSWGLVRMPANSKLKAWDNPRFSRMDGSWYQERLSNGMTYIRYYLSAEVDSEIPGWIIRTVAGDQIADGVQAVIRTLAQEASTSP